MHDGRNNQQTHLDDGLLPRSRGVVQACLLRPTGGKTIINWDEVQLIGLVGLRFQKMETTDRGGLRGCSQVGIGLVLQQTLHRRGITLRARLATHNNNHNVNH